MSWLGMRQILFGRGEPIEPDLVEYESLCGAYVIFEWLESPHPVRFTVHVRMEIEGEFWQLVGRCGSYDKAAARARAHANPN